MTKLHEIVKEKGISLYGLCGIIGKNTSGFNSHLKKQLIGDLPMSYNDYITILNYLGKTEAEVPYDIVKIRVK